MKTVVKLLILFVKYKFCWQKMWSCCVVNWRGAKLTIIMWALVKLATILQSLTVYLVWCNAYKIMISDWIFGLSGNMSGYLIDIVCCVYCWFLWDLLHLNLEKKYFPGREYLIVQIGSTVTFYILSFIQHDNNMT